MVVTQARRLTLTHAAVSGVVLKGEAVSWPDRGPSSLGHVSIQTTERYLGCRQKLRCAVNDKIGLEPDDPS
jgi:hypothetical protein